jgi:Na+/phosphate symporter
MEAVGEYQQELFNYLSDLGIIALQSEMQEIERIVLKRMYSEEEVLDIFFNFFCHQIDEDVKNKLSFQQFIKQFKKQ